MLRGLCASVVFAVLIAGCGGGVFRPLRLAIRGFSARADVLVLKAFPAEELGCTQIDQNAAPGLGAPFEERWVRADGGDRELTLPEIEGDGITVLVYSESADGLLLQYMCRDISIDDVATAPDETIRIDLPPRS